MKRWLVKITVSDATVTKGFATPRYRLQSYKYFIFQCAHIIELKKVIPYLPLHCNTNKYIIRVKESWVFRHCIIRMYLTQGTITDDSSTEMPL